MRHTLNEERERHVKALIEHAIALYEKGLPIEEEFTPEELQELWGGLKKLATKGAQAIGGAAARAGRAVVQGVDNAVTKADNFATKINDKGMDALRAGGNAIKSVGNAVGTTVNNVKNSVADTYRQGEVESLVQKIHQLNNQYKQLTGKSFIRQFSAVSKPIPNAAKNTTVQAKQPSAKVAMNETWRLQRLANLL